MMFDFSNHIYLLDHEEGATTKAYAVLFEVSKLVWKFKW